MSQGDLLAHHNIRHDKEEYMSGGIFCVSSCQNFLMAISFHLTGKSLDTKWLNPSARNSTGNEPPAQTTLITCLRKENSLEKQARVWQSSHSFARHTRMLEFPNAIEQLCFSLRKRTPSLHLAPIGRVAHRRSLELRRSLEARQLISTIFLKVNEETLVLGQAP